MSNFEIWLWFLSRGKKTTVNCCLYESKHIIMKKLVYAPTNIVRSSKFVCNIATKRFIGWGKNVELLSWSLQTTS